MNNCQPIKVQYYLAIVLVRSLECDWLILDLFCSILDAKNDKKATAKQSVYFSFDWFKNYGFQNLLKYKVKNQLISP